MYDLLDLALRVIDTLQLTEPEFFGKGKESKFCVITIGTNAGTGVYA